MKAEHKLFYQHALEALKGNTLAIFAGAGLSKTSGFVNWKELLKDITEDLQLDYSKEDDLISIAQYHYNKVGGKSMLNDRIITEFNKDVDISINHKILARLPIQTYWTTNYDDLIERSLAEAKRVREVKHSVSQLRHSRPRKDATVYKMHGDLTLPEEAIITKDDYEHYHIDRAAFVNALEADLQSKLFLFIGFSFSDPNLDYILSRVRIHLKGKNKHHYHFVKRVARNDHGIKDDADFEYKSRKQSFFVEDLKRFGLQPVYVDRYAEISEILFELESQYRRGTVFISGSAEEYGKYDRNDAQKLIHSLSKKLITSEFRIVNGFGWGVGSAVINGALDAIYERPDRYSDSQLIVRPFPQFESGGNTLKVLWEEYRQRMIMLGGVAIFLFGNKMKDGKVIIADGMIREFQISVEHGLVPIPIACTGYATQEIYEIIKADPGKYYPSHTWLLEYLEKLANEKITADKIVDTLIEILNRIK